MSNKRSAPDGLKFATYLWRTERDSEYARSVLVDLLASHADSDEAAAASNLLEEINTGALSINETNISAPSKNKAARHVTTMILVATGIGLIFFGRGVMYSGPTGDGGIYGLFGLLLIAAGGLLVVATLIVWVVGTLTQLFGGKSLVAWLCVLIIAPFIVSLVASVIGG